MHEILLDIRQRLLGKEYKNEEHVRLSLVARVVQALGWDIWNPTEVFTEFKATKKEDNTRVDMALFTHGFEATAIFIECKGVGAFSADLAAAERQLRDYNRDHTALFTIITDGRHWRFYFSFTSGEFKDKLFCKFDLQQDGLEEIAGYLETFLLRENITNHSARQKAEAYLMLGKKERAMQDVLPDAQKLVSLPPFPSLPAAMVQLLAAKVLVVTPAEAQAFLMGNTLGKAADSGVLFSAAKPASKPAKPLAAKPDTPAKKPAKPQSVTATAAAPEAIAASTHQIVAEELAVLIGEQFVLKQGVAHAIACLQADGGLRVMAGSVVIVEPTASLTTSEIAARQKLVNEGVLQMRGEQMVFVTDYAFNSANKAARMVVASAINGQLAWKHASGKQVRDFLK